uniref:Uncharacterized protein n=1 Tax=Triticum urartu TaxID=4572 RepID=A0A8R7PAV0_TRIUA
MHLHDLDIHQCDPIFQIGRNEKVVQNSDGYSPHACLHVAMFVAYISILMCINQIIVLFCL